MSKVENTEKVILLWTNVPFLCSFTIFLSVNKKLGFLFFRESSSMFRIHPFLFASLQGYLHLPDLDFKTSILNFNLKIGAILIHVGHCDNYDLDC